MALDQTSKIESAPENEGAKDETAQKLAAAADLSKEQVKAAENKASVQPESKDEAKSTSSQPALQSAAKLSLSLPLELASAKGIQLSKSSLFKSAFTDAGHKPLPMAARIETAPEKAAADSSFSLSISNALSKINVKSAIDLLGAAAGYVSNPIGPAISLGSSLLKVSENLYQSADKKLTVSKLSGSESRQLKDDWEQMFNSDSPILSSKLSAEDSKLSSLTVERVSSVDDPASLPKEAMRWLFDQNEKVEGTAVSDNLFSYTTDDGGKAEITAKPGHVHIEKTDADGKLRTIVDKTSGKTLLIHDNESVHIEGDKQIVKGPGYTVSWDDAGKRHVTLDSGEELIRDRNSVKIKSAEMDLLVKKHVLESETGAFAFTNAPANELSKLIEEKRAQLKEGETFMLMIRGSGIAAIYDKGTLFVNGDQARLETTDKQVFRFQVKDDKLFLKQGEQLHAVDSDNTPVKVEGGKFRLGDLLIDPENLRMQLCDKERSNSCGPTMDMRNGTYKWHDRRGKLIEAHTKEDGSIVLDHDKRRLENNPFDSNVKITTLTPGAATETGTGGSSLDKAPPAPEIKVNLDSLVVDTAKLVDEPDRTFIKDTKTVIKEDRTVEFENGPTVKRDGTVQLDRHTYVSNELSVHSKGWDSHAAQIRKEEITEANARSIAQTVSSKAGNLANLAKAGNVSWTDLAALNGALGDLLSIMSSLPPGSPAYAMLANSYRLIVDAIAQALPKAQKAEEARGEGLSSKEEIKTVLEGASIEQVKSKKTAA